MYFVNLMETNSHKNDGRFRKEPCNESATHLSDELKTTKNVEFIGKKEKMMYICNGICFGCV